MATNKRRIRIGTRGSALAQWQTNHVRQLLQTASPGLRVDVEIITTKGDHILDKPLPLVGGKGLFTAELEQALRSGAIDFAVHSLKDLPTEMTPGLIIGAVTQRVNVADVLISRDGHTLKTLPDNAIIGTSSRRRAGQLKHYNSSWKIGDIRGNVDTRIRKALDTDGDYDAIILAHAGVERLNRLDVVSDVLPLDVMLPAPGQGALGIQCRDEADSLNILAAINDRDTSLTTTAERAFLNSLGGGCAVPIAAYGHIEDDILHLRGRINSLDGISQIESEDSVSLQEPNDNLALARRLGEQLAENILKQGASEILEALL
ncbi:MAG: hydroxymethylbilane synthase [Phototrophicales bacterium]|nr:MAG: hydroxymethylbilane synthase [Phototrophicales bacterium]